MNAPKCDADDYINFLVASPRVVSGTEAARVQPDRDDPPAHDAFTRLLHRLEPDPACLVFDSWYASLANLKAIRGHGWRWVTQLKANRLVNPDGRGNRPLGECATTEAGTRVHLQGYGFILVFLIVTPDGDREFWATSDEGMGELTRRKYAEWAWGIEVYHRGLKQHCGVERAEVRAARAQRNHINCAIRAFLRLEQHRLVTGVSWWEAKTAIIREAIRQYLAHPRYTLASMAEATA